MDEDDELLGGREPVEDLNSTARGRPERAAQIVDRFDGDSTIRDRHTQGHDRGARIAARLSDIRKRLALGLRDIVSPDFATWSWRHRLTSRIIEQADHHSADGERRRGRSGDVAVTNWPRELAAGR